MSWVDGDCRWFVGLEAGAGQLEVGQEELRAAWVGEELLRANHTILGGVVEVPDRLADGFVAGAAVDEVVPCAVGVSAFACVGLFRKIFPEAASVVGSERVARGEAEGRGGGVP